MALLEGIGEAAGRIGRRAIPVAERGGRFMTKHPRMIAGAALALGVAASHPVRPVSAAAQEVLLGDPDAARKMMTASINVGLSNAMMDSYSRNQVDFLESQYNVGNAGYSYYGAGYVRSLANPDGSLVFGLYNDRMR